MAKRTQAASLTETSVMTARAPIYLIGGSKGGVGKSMVAGAMLDYLMDKQVDFHLVETDTSNPDVATTYGTTVPSTLLNLDEAEGWIELLNLADSSPDMAIVINTAARNNHSVTRHGSILNDGLHELGRQLVTLWVINRQRDSLQLLHEFKEVFTCEDARKIRVIRNGHFGEAAKFQLYEHSKIKQRVEEEGGGSHLFPDLADRVSDQLYTQRLMINEAVQSLSLGDRMELKRWRSLAHQMFDEVTGG